MPAQPETLTCQLRDDVSWILRTCRKLAVPEAVQADLTCRAGLVRRRLDDPNLHLAIIGEFNSGKSTFLNTLLRDPLLPTAPVVTTGCAIEVRHGPTLRMALRPHPPGFVPMSGESARRAIHAVVTDPHRCADFEVMTIEHPTQLLGRDVVIIDTPGINADEDGHTEIVDRVVTETADLAVIVVAAGSAVSRVLLDFLTSTLSRHLDRCAFVVTKLDQIEPDQREFVLRSIRRRLSSVGVPADRVVVGSGEALLHRLVNGAPMDEEMHRFLRLEQELARLANQERTRAVHLTASYLVTDLIEAVTVSVCEHRSVIETTERELAGLRVPDLGRFLADARSRVQAAIDAERERLRRRFRDEATDIKAGLDEELSARLAACETTEQIGDLTTGSAAELVTTRLTQWSPGAQSDSAARLANVGDREVRRVHSEFVVESQRLARLAGDVAATIPVPIPQARLAKVPESIDFGSAAAMISSSLSTENWAVGGGVAVGALVGTMVLPGIGTAIGGLLGGILGAGAGSQRDKVRGQVRQPLIDGARCAVNDALGALLAAVDEQCTAVRQHCEQCLDGLQRAVEAPLARLLEQERAHRAALRQELALAADAQQEAGRRLERLAAHRRQLT